ncbi:MAG: AAA family ATPase [Microscillaceae bacterium]|jgi:predicted ATP-dependent endonuclease of OLD family|nr:AAA family ATPase [Microscillaceae bacterium]
MDEKHLIELENRFIQLKNQGKNLDEITALLQIDRSLLEEWNGYFEEFNHKIKNSAFYIVSRNHNLSQERYNIKLKHFAVKNSERDIDSLTSGFGKYISEHSINDFSKKVQEAKEYLDLIIKGFTKFNVLYYDDLDFVFEHNEKIERKKAEEIIEFYKNEIFIPAQRKHTQINLFKNLKIKTLKINDIRVFDKIYFEFKSNISIIIGNNARGKSTILQLIALAFSGLKRPPVPYNWEKVVKNNQLEGSFELEILLENQSFPLTFKINQADEIEIIDFPTTLKNQLSQTFIIAYGANRSIKREDLPNYEQFESIATLFGVNGYLKNFNDSSTFQTVQLNFVWLANTINEIFEASGTNPKIYLHSFNAKQFEFCSPFDSSTILPLESLSEGFKATFVWLFDLLVRIIQKRGSIIKPQEIFGIVMIDEIDLHLHPTWQRTILPSLQKVFPNIQFIVTTHSPFVVQSIDMESVLILNQDSTNNMIVHSFDIDSALSYQAIVREIFGIESSFSVEVEQDLAIFRELRNKIIRGESVDLQVFKDLILELSAKGVEVEGVVRRELRQLEKITNQEFVLDYE